MVGMSNADASERAELAARARWGARVAVRSAHVVIDRAGELPADVREAVHLATGPAGGEPGESAR